MGQSAGECQDKASSASKVNGGCQNECLTVSGCLGRKRARKMVPARIFVPRDKFLPILAPLTHSSISQQNSFLYVPGTYQIAASVLGLGLSAFVHRPFL